jgi:hypothetical protein
MPAKNEKRILMNVNSIKILPVICVPVVLFPETKFLDQGTIAGKVVLAEVSE